MKLCLKQKWWISTLGLYMTASLILPGVLIVSDGWIWLGRVGSNIVGQRLIIIDRQQLQSPTNLATPATDTWK